MGLFDSTIPTLAQASVALGQDALKKKQAMPVPGQPAPMFQPTLPQGGYNQTSSAQGPTSAQVFQPLVNRMAGVPHMSAQDRQTMQGNGQGLSTESAWRSMFAHGANDLSPEQLRASQGGTALNQWADPAHFHGSRPGDLNNADSAAMASPAMFDVSDKSRAMLGSPQREPTLRDIVQQQQGSNPFANTRPESAPAMPAPQGSNGPRAAASPMGSPSPNFRFGVGQNDVGMPAMFNGQPSKTNVPNEMFGPTMPELMWPPTSPAQKLKDKAARFKAMDDARLSTTQPPMVTLGGM